VTRRVVREVTTVHRLGTEVTVLGPGREDLEAIGGNLMDLSRRPSVIETSLRTSALALRDPLLFLTATTTRTSVDILPAMNDRDSNCYATLGGRAC